MVILDRWGICVVVLISRLRLISCLLVPLQPVWTSGVMVRCSGLVRPALIVWVMVLVRVRVVVGSLVKVSGY